jgi:DNA-binding NarL/FixJ family response regulator
MDINLNGAGRSRFSLHEKKPAQVSGHAEKGLLTVIVLEGRQLMRDLLFRSLSRTDGFEVFATATVEECIELTSTKDAVAVLMGLRSDPHAVDSQEVLQRATQGMRAPIIVLCEGEKPYQVVSALQAGARGYIPTSMSLDVVIGAIRLVQAGGQFVPASCLTEMRDANPGTPVADLPSHLSGMFTARQTAVIAALRQGKQNKIIAYELNMRESTVKVHVRNIMKKLKATNRTEVAYITNQLGAAA